MRGQEKEARLKSIVGKLEPFARLPTALRPSRPVKHWGFHQPEKELTTLPSCDMAPVIEKGGLPFAHQEKIAPTQISNRLEIVRPGPFYEAVFPS